MVCVVWHGLGIKACGLLMFGSLLRGVSVTVSKSTVIKNHLSVSAVIMKFVGTVRYFYVTYSKNIQM